jgi:regulatory subunit for Cdc7p protein kinase
MEETLSRSVPFLCLLLRVVTYGYGSKVNKADHGTWGGMLLLTYLKVLHLTNSQREEKFFSRAVTHIVTTRAIPPSLEQETSNGHASIRGASTQSTQKTINPSLLERGTDALAHALQRGPKHVADIQRARQGGSADILCKARELGMKIWALEKFERMMDTMFHVDGGEEEPTQRKSRATEHNLQQIMRHEKEKASAAERPLFGDIIPFRGYYIYVHDMDEKLKPVMVREYKTVHEKEDGDWPQFRSVPLPRCPFIEDPQAVKREAREVEKRRRQREAEEELRRAQRQQPRTRAAAATLEAARDGRPALHESEQASNRTIRQAPTTVPVKIFDPPAVTRTATNTSLDSMPPRMATAHFTVNARPGLEPMASGLQQANVTSAIRSQMISSTAAAPSVRNIPPKDMHHLQRRAVERRTTLSTTSVPAAEEPRAAVQAEPIRRTARRKPELARIHEDGEEEECSQRIVKEKAVVQRDPKPGYCENCRDKYDDFVQVWLAG